MVATAAEIPSGTYAHGDSNSLTSKFFVFQLEELNISDGNIPADTLLMKLMADMFDATAKNLFIRLKGVHKIDFNALTDALRGYTVWLRN